VGMAAATAAVLRLPLSAIVIAAVLTQGSGAGSEPLVIVGTIVAYMVSRTLLPRPAAAAPAAAAPTTPTATPTPSAQPAAASTSMAPGR
jgi:chloride channel protein, CIC family